MEERKQSRIERIGSKLPEISILFLILMLVTAIASLFLKGTHIFNSVGTEVVVNNALSPSGFMYIMDNLIANFIGFAPLGIVLGIIIGVGVAEKSGLLGVVLKQIGIKSPEWALIPIIVFLGVISSIAADAGYIVLIPLAGALFASINKNPLIGIAAAFAGVSAGFGANLLPTPGDALLGAITIDVAEANGIPFAQNVVLMNYFFLIASTFLLTIVGTVITNKFIVPKFKDRSFEMPKEIDSSATSITDEQSRGLKAAGRGLIIVAIAFTFVQLWITFVHGGFYQDITTGELVTGNAFESWSAFKEGMTIDSAIAEKLLKARNPLVDNIIVVMLFLFLVPGYAYGKTTGQIKSANDYIKMTTEAMADSAYILVLAFFAGNFVALFSWTGIGNLIASSGANLLISSGLNQFPVLLLIGFILVSAVINLFIGSASAKWTLLAPVFIPMLYGANSELTPDLIQVAYRVADSSTNIISPLMTYTGIVILYGMKYDKKFNYGTLTDMMYPYSFGFLISWTAFFILWFMTGLPIGM